MKEYYYNSCYKAVAGQSDKKQKRNINNRVNKER